MWWAVRFNALSRSIESALQKEGIASRVLGGHKFFERAEVRLPPLAPNLSLTEFLLLLLLLTEPRTSQIKDILAYLQIVDNPHFVPSFSRAINTPNRGIGDKVRCSLPPPPW